MSQLERSRDDGGPVGPPASVTRYGAALDRSGSAPRLVLTGEPAPGSPGSSLAAGIDIVGREEELSRARSIVRLAARGQGGAAVVCGEPGIGKSTLLDATRSGLLANALCLHGLPAESHVPYAALHRLITEVDARTDPADRGSEGAFLGVIGHSPGARLFEVGRIVLQMLARVSAREPTLILVDDTQCIDDESLAAIAFVARRLHSVPVAMLLAAGELGRQQAALVGLDTIAIAGLAKHHAETILEHATGLLDPAVRHRLVTAAHGNPEALVHFSRQLSPRQLAGEEALPSELALGISQRRAFRAQLDALSPGSRSVIQVAAFDSSGDEQVILDAAARVSVPLQSWDELTGLLETGPTLVFRPGLLRPAARQVTTPRERRVIHDALAEAYRCANDLARAGLHRGLATSAPDDEHAGALQDVATKLVVEARAQAALLERAGQLTLDPEARDRRLVAAAQLLASDADPLRAGKLLKAAVRVRGGHDHVSQLRAAAAIDSQLGRYKEGFHRLVSALRSVTDPTLRSVLAIEALTVHVLGTLRDGRPPGNLADLDRQPEPNPDEPDGVNRIVDVLARRARGPISGSVDLTAVLTGSVLTAPGALSIELAAVAALETFDERALDRWSSSALQAARTTCARQPLRAALSARSIALTLTGDLVAADQHHAELDTLNGIVPWNVVSFRTPSLLSEAWRPSRIDRDGELLERATRPGPLPRLQADALDALGRGSYADACASLRQIHHADPPGYGTVLLADMVEAGVRAGSLDLAVSALGRLEERASRSSTDWALGLLARARSQACADPEASHIEAIERLGRTSLLPDLARAHLLYGEWLRRQKRRSDARLQLRAALERFTAMDAPVFRERARRELDATGERARRRSVETATDLTPQEHRIATLAASHRTNKEIATELYLSPSTIEYHLHNVFLKLQIGSRRDLRKALGSTTGGGPRSDPATTSPS